MLTVLSVGPHDESLAYDVLSWVKELDGNITRHNLLLLFNVGFDGKRIEAKARETFEKVTVYRVSDCPYGITWPRPQNWAWQRIAKAIASGNIGDFPYWFWWEPDAIPIKTGWMDAIEKAHLAGKQPFSGCLAENANGQYMAGVGVWPRAIARLCAHALTVREHPFDVVSSIVDGNLRKTHDLNPLLLSVRPDETRNVNVNCDNAERLINADTVLFHPNKDGSLLAFLRGEKPEVVPEEKPVVRRRGRPRKPVKQPVIQSVGEELSVVVTTHQRSAFLKQALKSLKTAGVNHVIVAASGVNDAVRKQISSNQNVESSIQIESDPGNTIMWLEGVKRAKTDWVHVLHDDDIVLPNFRSIEQHLNGNISFACWDGMKHGQVKGFNEATGRHSILPLLKHGVHPNRMVLSTVLNRGNSISPVSGAFKRTHLINALQSFYHMFPPPQTETKPGFQVGNDLFIWLRASEHEGNFLYHDTPIISYGHHDESASCQEVTRGDHYLLLVYQSVRRGWLRTQPRILHVVPRYAPSDPEAVRRIRNAEKTWLPLYQTGMVVPLHIWHHHRTSADMFDKTSTCYMRDLIEYGHRSCSRDDDIVMLTNDDTCLQRLIPWFLLSSMPRNMAMCSHRVTFNRATMPSGDVDPSKIYETADFNKSDPGRDLFALTPKWCERWLPEFPDYLSGYTDWDSTLATLIGLSYGINGRFESRSEEYEIPKGYVFHEHHHSVWAKDGNRDTLTGNVHNRKLTKAWVKKWGIGGFVNSIGRHEEFYDLI